MSKKLKGREEKDILFAYEALCLPSTGYSARNPEGADKTIKMMDTILFDRSDAASSKDFVPLKWIFTDLHGNVQYKFIKTITVNDVIRAFLVNLNESDKRYEFNNEDLMHFIEHARDEPICFALVGGKRHFLNIVQLCDIKNRFKKGVDALQLYKIPTRSFVPAFYIAHYKAKAPRHRLSKRPHDYDAELPLEPQETAAFGEELFVTSSKVVTLLCERGFNIAEVKIVCLVEQQ